MIIITYSYIKKKKFMISNHIQNLKKKKFFVQ
jgi:hypothetical protein